MDMKWKKVDIAALQETMWNHDATVTSSDGAHSMHQLEVLGASLLLKLLVTDLWTLLWTILFIHLMWENSSLLFTKICSVLDMKSHSHLSHQHILCQLETAVLDSTHTMHNPLHQDEVQL